MDASKTTQWFTIIGELPSEYAEIMEAFLVEWGATGVQTIDAEAVPPGVEPPPAGRSRLVGYLPSENESMSVEEWLDAWKTAVDRWELAPVFSLARVEPLEEENWNEQWKRFFHPQTIGKHIRIEPSWDRGGGSPDDIVLQIDPGMAFGTGTHESTRLCLEWIEAACELQPPRTILDTGCGSGILSIAASKLGVSDGLGIDIDPEAIVVARENYRLNDMDTSRWHLSEHPVSTLDEEFSLVVANMLSGELAGIVDDLVRLTAPGGHLVLAGILNEEEEDVTRMFQDAAQLQSAKLIPVVQSSMGDWRLLSFEKDSGLLDKRSPDDPLPDPFFYDPSAEEDPQEGKKGGMPRLSLPSMSIFYLLLAALAVLLAPKFNPFVVPGQPERGDFVHVANGLWLGLFCGVTLVAASQLSYHYFSWSRKLERSFFEILGPLGLGQITVVAIASGVAEEMLFRGAIQPFIGLIPASLLFALLHIGPGREFLPWTISAGVIGLLLGLLYEHTGNLAAPVICHFTVNFINLNVIMRRQKKQENALLPYP